MSLIATVLWPGMKTLEKTSQLGGILARKPGYHNSRDRLPGSDYSVAQFKVDRQGPANESAGVDWTFPEAQGGNYTRISKYSKRLLAAGRAGDNDPRTVYMREFFGNSDTDREVEGWDFSKNRAASSDSSHLWHIHISIHRKYVNDPRAMQAILSILKGESVATWAGRGKPPVTIAAIEGALPILKFGMEDPIDASGWSHIARAQRLLQVDDDGVYGPDTQAKVKSMSPDTDGKTIDIGIWRRLIGIRSGADITPTK